MCLLILLCSRHGTWLERATQATRIRPKQRSTTIDCEIIERDRENVLEREGGTRRHVCVIMHRSINISTILVDVPIGLVGQLPTGLVVEGNFREGLRSLQQNTRIVPVQHVTL